MRFAQKRMQVSGVGRISGSADGIDDLMKKGLRLDEDFSHFNPFLPDGIDDLMKKGLRPDGMLCKTRECRDGIDDLMKKGLRRPKSARALELLLLRRN